MCFKALRPESTRFVHVIGVQRRVDRHDCKGEFEIGFFLEFKRYRCCLEAHWRDQMEEDIQKRVQGEWI